MAKGTRDFPDDFQAVEAVFFRVLSSAAGHFIAMNQLFGREPRLTHKRHFHLPATLSHILGTL